MAHTPGPWQIHRANSSRRGYDVETANGRRLVAFNLSNEANARLIAAAPELLAALTDLIALAEEGLRNRESDANDGVRGAQAAYETGCKEIAAADAAIAKATGKAVQP